MAALRRHDCIISGLNPLPAIVAIHRKISARHGGDLRLRRQRGAELFDKAKRASRGHIAAIGDRMDTAGHACRAQHLQRCKQMRDMAMHPAIGHKSHYMRSPAAALKLCDKRLKRCVLTKRAIFDR